MIATGTTRQEAHSGLQNNAQVIFALRKISQVSGFNQTIRLADTETYCAMCGRNSTSGFNQTIRLADTETGITLLPPPNEPRLQPNDPTRGY